MTGDTTSDMPTADDIRSEDEKEAWEQARDALRERMNAVETLSETWKELQEMYFKAEFEVRARRDDFPVEHFDPHRLTATRGRARDTNGIEVCDPLNPFTTHGVTIDHEIGPDGSVTCEVNGTTLDELGERPGSHIN